MIYLVAPNATHPSGGVGVAAQWVKLLIKNGYEAMFITPNGDPSPSWLSFEVPTGGYKDVQDIPENKVVHIWMDCLKEFRTHHAKLYYFAQDVCQPQYNETTPGRFEAEYLPLLRQATLITLTHHAHYYYLYRFGLPSKIVNNFVDTDLFKYTPDKDPRAVAMINHRDHFNPEIAKKLEKAGFTVKIAQGSQAEVAKTFGECLFFVSDVRGRWDGFEYSEGMPMPIMEAMATGCVVYCRDTNGVNEFLIDAQNGHFFENDEIAMRIEEMSDPSNLDTHLDTALLAAKTMFHAFNKENIWMQIQEALELK